MKKTKSKNAHGAHLVFKNEAKIYAWDVFVGINIIWKFGDYQYIFFYEGDRAFSQNMTNIWTEGIL